ncbi:MAG TPA: tetratricopeptide repeat protein [Myxococcales bacterium]
MRTVLLAVAMALPATALAVPKAPCASGSECKKKCDAGALDGCWGLGVMKADGREGFVDEKGALELFKKACDGGFALGCASQASATKDPAASLALARKACDLEAALGCVLLGIKYRDGSGVAKDPKQALAFARKGCDGGETMGCIQAGMLMLDAGDAKGAVKLLDGGCQGGARDACHNLAILFGTGKAVAKDEARAIALLEKACDLGLADDCELAARLVIGDKKGDAQASAKAEQLTRKACELGSGSACYLASVKAPKEEKSRWAEKACAAEIGEGCFKVAIIAEEANDLGRAVDFHDRACRTGWKMGCESATKLIAQGVGKAEIAKPYFETLLKACEAGQFAGCEMPVTVLRKGHPAIPRDVARAVKILEKSCEAKDATSCATLSQMYRGGLDVAKDAARGELYRKKACALDEKACSVSQALPTDAKK